MIKKGEYTIEKIYLGGTEVTQIYLGSTLVYSNELGDESYFYLKALSGNTNFTINLISSASLQYSVNEGGTWQNVVSGSPISVQQGKKVYLKGNNARLATTAATTGSTRILGSNKFEAGGHLNSLLNGDNYTQSKTVSVYTFNALFSGSTNLENAEKLIFPSYITANSCYRNMFANCTNLTKGPITLPSATAGQYFYACMFSGCTNLTTAPLISATTLSANCCQYMFYRCSKLASTQTVLNPTSIPDRAYQYMFAGCKLLTTTPKLPATTIGTQSYKYMFSGCTSLNKIYANISSFSTTANTAGWVTSVPTSGGTYYGSEILIILPVYGTYAIPSSSWTLKAYS